MEKMISKRTDEGEGTNWKGLWQHEMIKGHGAKRVKDFKKTKR